MLDRGVDGLEVGEQALADRFTYVPAIGLCIALAWAAGDALGGVAEARTRASVAAAVAPAGPPPRIAIRRKGVGIASTISQPQRSINEIPQMPLLPCDHVRARTR